MLFRQKKRSEAHEKSNVGEQDSEASRPARFQGFRMSSGQSMVLSVTDHAHIMERH